MKANKQLPALDQDTVHYWVADLADWAGQIEDLRPLLDPAELKRIERLIAAPKRTSSLISAGILRLMLSSYLDIPPARLEILRHPAGKPFLEGSPIQFNLSHSGSYLVCAAALERQIGVDIQEMYAISHLEQVTRLVFCPEEKSYLASLPESRLQEGFFAIWTAKEAYLKARGSGFQEEASRICLLPDKNDPRSFVLTDPESADTEGGWTIRSLDIHPGYQAAFAITGQVAEVLKVDFLPGDRSTANQRHQLRISRTS